MSNKLDPERGLIFRITHKDNLSWILDNGLHCRNSATRNAQFVSIGNQELIDKRHFKPVPIDPGGTLSDYIPFYFTPHSPMMLNIKTGFNGIKKRSNAEIVILVSSLPKLNQSGVRFVFTDRHAYLKAARFFADAADLNKIDWPLLNRRDFKKDPNDPEKMARYEAEALVYQHLAVDALLGIVCYTDSMNQEINILVRERNLDTQVIAKPKWYF